MKHPRGTRGRVYQERNYITPRLGETREHARKRVFKGIVGCRPASHVERVARTVKVNR